MKLTVISTHQDDAALSISLALAEFARCSIFVRIINCFTVSQFLPFKDQQDNESNIRASEDQKFTAEFHGKIECINLGHKDAPLRTGRGVRGILKGERNSPSDKAEIRELASHIVHAAKSEPLLIPLAADLHIDHHLAREAALSLCSGRAFGIYEDLPYTTRMIEPDIRKKILELGTRLDAELHPVLLGRGHSLELKCRCIRCYSSQVGERTIQEVLNYSNRYHGAERLWVTESLIEGLVKAGAALESDQRLCNKKALKGATGESCKECKEKESRQKEHDKGQAAGSQGKRYISGVPAGTTEPSR